MDWFLINASPDLRTQIEAYRELQPGVGRHRNSPIRGVLLTNADLDHVLGLTLLREGAMPNVYATPAVRDTLQSSLGLDRLLGAFSGIRWLEPATEYFPLIQHKEGDPDLLVRMIPLPGDAPRFARGESQHREGHSIALQFQDKQSGARLLVAPDVAEVTPALSEALEESDAVLFDGTFWTDDELQQISPGARTSRQMGHLPVHSGSLDVLRSLRARHRIYLHINNTNPILAAVSPQRAAVEAAGVRVGEDGWQFEL